MIALALAPATTSSDEDDEDDEDDDETRIEAWLVGESLPAFEPRRLTLCLTSPLSTPRRDFAFFQEQADAIEVWQEGEDDEFEPSSEV